MRKRLAGIILLILGAALLGAALLLFTRSQSEDRAAGTAAQELLMEAKAQIAQSQQAQSAPSGSSEDAASASLVAPEAEKPGAARTGGAVSAPHSGDDVYAGILEIPALELELPVLADWSYPLLEKAPCRQFGAVATGDLVIAAHNYKSHFGWLSELQPGDLVLFTGMDGTCLRYSVTEVQTLADTDVAAVQNSGYPLTLYTCTPGGKMRTCVFCTQILDQNGAPVSGIQ